MKRATKIFLIVAACILASCASAPVLPENISSAELIQRGQEAVDAGRYTQAIQYFQAILDRFPGDLPMICNAEYEIAHTYYKQKKYGQARQELHALLSRYEGEDAELLPPHFKRLAEILLDTIGDDPAAGTSET